MGRKGDSITLSISDRDKSQLEELALELGMKWGDRPNISKLVEAIARKQIQISKNNDWSSDRIEALNRTWGLLIDYGEINLAKAIANLLLERSEITSPLRRDIERFLDKPPEIWRQVLDRYIRQNQPFRLIYRDAAEHPYEFSIYHANISPHDKRLYLDCWCAETTGSDDIESLRHNRCLRIDRIPAEAAITPIQGKWRSQLAQVTVTFQLSGKLAFAYKPKKDDTDDIWLHDFPIRQISRTVSSTFWFYREIMPYVEDCEIIDPDDVRQKFKEKVRSLYLKYSGN